MALLARLAIAGAAHLASRETSETVSSSAIGEVGYNELSEELTITFKDGSTYTYEDVPYDVYSSLLSAGSTGGYFNANIRDEYSVK